MIQFLGNLSKIISNQKTADIFINDVIRFFVASKGKKNPKNLQKWLTFISSERFDEFQ